jgi:hypothetical protein
MNKCFTWNRPTKHGSAILQVPILDVSRETSLPLRDLDQHVSRETSPLGSETRVAAEPKQVLVTCFICSMSRSSGRVTDAVIPARVAGVPARRF